MKEEKNKPFFDDASSFASEAKPTPRPGEGPTTSPTAPLTPSICTVVVQVFPLFPPIVLVQPLALPHPWNRRVPQFIGVRIEVARA